MPIPDLNINLGVQKMKRINIRNKFKSLHNMNSYRSLENVRLSNVPEASVSQEICDILDMKS